MKPEASLKYVNPDTSNLEDTCCVVLVIRYTAVDKLDSKEEE